MCGLKLNELNCTVMCAVLWRMFGGEWRGYVLVFCSVEGYRDWRERSLHY